MLEAHRGEYISGEELADNLFRIVQTEAKMKRENIKGFKSEEEFFTFINLKKHLVDNIREHIVIRKVQVKKSIKLYKERQIDL